MAKNLSPIAPKISVSAREAAIICSLSRATLYNCMNDGRLPFVKIGYRRLILLSDLETFLVSYRTRSEARTEIRRMMKPDEAR